MAEVTSFYMVLPSNVESFANNKISNFKTLLPRHIALSGEWEVALTEISFPKSWYTLSDICEVSFLVEGTAQVLPSRSQVTIQPGTYQSEIALANHIREEILKSWMPPNKINTYTILRYPSISYDNKQLHFIMSPGVIKNPGDYVERNVYPIFSGSLQKILEFPSLDFWRELHELQRDIIIEDEILKVLEENHHSLTDLVRFALGATLKKPSGVLFMKNKPKELLKPVTADEIKLYWIRYNSIQNAASLRNFTFDTGRYLLDDKHGDEISLNDKIHLTMYGNAHIGKHPIEPYRVSGLYRFEATNGSVKYQYDVKDMFIVPVLPDQVLDVFGGYPSATFWENVASSKKTKGDYSGSLYDYIKGNPSYHSILKKWKGESETIPQWIPAFEKSEIGSLYRHLFVYCDIVEPTYVGDTYNKLLRVCHVPVDVPFGENVVHTYEKPYYVKLATNEFETLEIHIKGDDDRSVPFEFGTSIVTLHFRLAK